MSSCPVIPPFPALGELTDVSLVIKTWERPGCLSRLLESILALGFRGPILIADDSSRPYREEILRRFGDHVANYEILPANSGVSFGRNALLDRVETPYFVLLDDDLLFDERVHLGLMRDIVASTEVDLVGACYYDRPEMTKVQARTLAHLLSACSRRQLRSMVDGLLWNIPWCRRKLPRLRHEGSRARFGNFVPGDPSALAPVPEPYRPPWVRCDFVPNFFLADVGSLRNLGIRWDDTLRDREEPLGFFMEAKTRGLAVAMTRETGIVRLGVANGLRLSVPMIHPNAHAS